MGNKTAAYGVVVRPLALLVCSGKQEGRDVPEGSVEFVVGNKRVGVWRIVLEICEIHHTATKRNARFTFAVPYQLEVAHIFLEVVLADPPVAPDWAHGSIAHRRREDALLVNQISGYKLATAGL